MATTTPHQGTNLKRIREILGVKQEALALHLGDDWNQQKISLLEQKEVIDPVILDQIAAVLHVKPEAIKNFNEESAVFNIQNNYDGASAGSGSFGQHLNFHNCTFNPIEEWLKALEENKRLYERLLQAEKEKITILEQQFKDRK